MELESTNHKLIEDFHSFQYQLDHDIEVFQQHQKQVDEVIYHNFFISIINFDNIIIII